MWLDRYYNSHEPLYPFEHRNSNSTTYSFTCIENIITRGDLLEWGYLREAVLRSKEVAKRVKEVCEHYSYLESQRFEFWIDYLHFKQLI